MSVITLICLQFNLISSPFAFPVVPTLYFSNRANSFKKWLIGRLIQLFIPKIYLTETIQNLAISSLHRLAFTTDFIQF